MEFGGFSKEALTFLGKLGRNNTREWFKANRDTYEAEIMGPAKAFVVAMGPKLHRLSPSIQADPRVNGSIRRIARDTRFSANKKPYKDHLDFFFIYEGGGNGYYLRISEKQLGIGAGAHMFDKKHLARYRDAVANQSGKKLSDAIKKLKRSGHEVGGEHYKRVPRGYDAEHERAALLRHAGLYVFVETKIPRDFTSIRFTDFCIKHFKNMSALPEWIDNEITGA